jgi:hypothetical protein
MAPNKQSEIEKFTTTPTKMYYVYLIKSVKDKNFYNGLVYSTKSRIPFELVYYEAYKSEGDASPHTNTLVVGARKREKNLKLRSRAFVQLKKRIQNSLKYEI